MSQQKQQRKRKVEYTHFSQPLMRQAGLLSATQHILSNMLSQHHIDSGLNAAQLRASYTAFKREVKKYAQLACKAIRRTENTVRSTALELGGQEQKFVFYEKNPCFRGNWTMRKALRVLDDDEHMLNSSASRSTLGDLTKKPNQQSSANPKRKKTKTHHHNHLDQKKSRYLMEEAAHYSTAKSKLSTHEERTFRRLIRPLHQENSWLTPPETLELMKRVLDTNSDQIKYTVMHYLIAQEHIPVQMRQLRHFLQLHLETPKNPNPKPPPPEWGRGYTNKLCSASDFASAMHDKMLTGNVAPDEVIEEILGHKKTERGWGSFCLFLMC